jgi:undecaprenyl diphosphate synthase
VHSLSSNHSKSAFFSPEELASLQNHALPYHVAMIMDGNRRWAKKNGFLKTPHPLSGHWAGAANLIRIVEAASELGIKVLTVFGFSTENWARSPQEIETLLKIFENYLREQRLRMVENGICFDVIGDLSPFSENIKEEIEKTREATKWGEKIDLIIAVNYGGRDEIKRALQKIALHLLSGELKIEQLSEEMISSALDTAEIRDPDLLIRTSGEMRISNFLLWQIAYAEVYVTDVFWPDFTPHDLLAAVREFQKRERRKGN